MHAPKFPEYENMVSGYVADGEFHTGMIFSNQKVVVRVVKNYNISRSLDYKVHESEPIPFTVSANTLALGVNSLLGSVSERIRTFGRSRNTTTCTLALRHTPQLK